MSGLAALAAIALFSARPAVADGGFFSFGGPSLENVAVSVDQRAIIMKCKDMVSITLSTGYTGNGGDFAWIIPIPVEPTRVSESGADGEQAFEQLDQITGVKVETVPAFGGSRNAGFRGSGPADSKETPASNVDVRARFTLAHYEVSILQSTASSALLDWLLANGYRVNASAGPVLGDYAARGWTFAAVKLSPGSQRAYRNEFLPPITLQYCCDQFVFPLRISTVSTVDSARITIYLIAESTVSSRNLPTRALGFERPLRYEDDPGTYVEAGIRVLVGGASRGMALLWSGRYDVETFSRVQQDLAVTSFLADDSFGRIFWFEDDDFFASEVAPFFQSGATKRGAIYLTRLETRMDPAAMSEDIQFVLDDQPRGFSVRLVPEGAGARC